MKQDAFVRKSKQQWKEFEEIIEGNSQLSLDYPDRYRALCTDLSIARGRNYSPVLVEKLNNLVRVGQRRFYTNEKGALQKIIAAVRHDFPLALHDNRYYVWASFALFFGLGLLGFFAIFVQADWIYLFLDSGMINDIESMYDPDGSAQDGDREREDDILMFGFYIYNNIGIAFQTFAGGIFFGIGALFYLVFNGVYFGLISGHIVNIGFYDPFFSFVIGHGSFELTAIAISGAAGCRMGMALLRPGKLSRMAALQYAAAAALPLIVGAFVMLVIAAGLEAFWSPRDFPVAVKYSVGAVLWVWVLYRLARGTRRGT